jgi:hypothetical protein
MWNHVYANACEIEHNNTTRDTLDDVFNGPELNIQVNDHTYQTE